VRCDHEKYRVAPILGPGAILAFNLILIGIGRHRQLPSIVSVNRDYDDRLRASVLNYPH
jgi:hypothetical protein